MLESYCENFGFEKRNLLQILQGPRPSNGYTEPNLQPPKSAQSVLKPDNFDTGKAAVLAYTNLQFDSEIKDEDG